MNIKTSSDEMKCTFKDMQTNSEMCESIAN